MRKIIVVTGASNGIGNATCKTLALAGHTVYASMRDTRGRNAPHVQDIENYARERGCDLRVIELDVASQNSTSEAIDHIVAENGRLDIVVHNAAQTAYGPAEAFTPEQLAEIFDANIFSTQRVNRAVLPQLRKQGHGLLVWISSSCARGTTSPFLSPYASSKAGMDALAMTYAGEIARWGIETSIIVPADLGPAHYLHSSRPSDALRAEEYSDGPTADISEIALGGLAKLFPLGTDSDIAVAIADVVEMPFGTRPLRIHVNPDHAGAAVIDAVAERIRAEFLRRIGLADLLKPAVIG
ncbi:SDR family oxidoreductase [Bradyrhizobium sp. STM 3557]|uniref:SDR family oxidoreductase n=1 Tax=Bradyrhizobium sp. STM 3557 TaxID=578920 RepID=UPI00388F02BB